MSETITYAFPKIKDIDPSCYIDAYTLILECSQAHTPRSFSIKLLELLKKVCPYDEAVVFFFNANGKVSGHYAVGIKPQWLEMYCSYYLGFLQDSSPQSDLYQNLNERSNFNFCQLIDWSAAPHSEFKTDYIDARHLKYTWSFTFFDLLGAYRVVFSLDRTRAVPFSEVELNRLRLALPILNNMHRNFFYQGMDTRDTVVQTPWTQYNLTARETEIATLLCQGMTAQNVSAALCIAITTTYKHISHIFQKTGVSSQQELLVKLLNQKAL